MKTTGRGYSHENLTRKDKRKCGNMIQEERRKQEIKDKRCKEGRTKKKERRYAKEKHLSAFSSPNTKVQGSPCCKEFRENIVCLHTLFLFFSYFLLVLLISFSVIVSISFYGLLISLQYPPPLLIQPPPSFYLSYATLTL